MLYSIPVAGVHRAGLLANDADRNKAADCPDYCRYIALIQQDLELAPERIRHSEALVKKLV